MWSQVEGWHEELSRGVARGQAAGTPEPDIIKALVADNMPQIHDFVIHMARDWPSWQDGARLLIDADCIPTGTAWDEDQLLRYRVGVVRFITVVAAYCTQAVADAEREGREVPRATLVTMAGLLAGLTSLLTLSSHPQQDGQG